MRIGLKLWSTNTDHYLREAKRLFHDGCFDYIELFIVPGSANTIPAWQELKDRYSIPFTLHAPHSAKGVNLADSEKLNGNITAYKDVESFRAALEPKYTVIHCGMSGTIDETIRQLKLIAPKNFIIENKPVISPIDIIIDNADGTIHGKPICRGATYEEVAKVLSQLSCGFCLDIGHAICAANTLEIAPYEFLQRLNGFKPLCYHISDNFADSGIDRHLHFGEGNYDLQALVKFIDADADVAIETNKSSKEKLDDFAQDAKILKDALLRID